MYQLILAPRVYILCEGERDMKKRKSGRFNANKCGFFKWVFLYYIFRQTFTYAFKPSSLYILGAASLKVLAYPGWVWIRTLAASIGARAMSAKNSALAEAAKYSDVRQR